MYMLYSKSTMICGQSDRYHTSRRKSRKSERNQIHSPSFLWIVFRFLLFLLSGIIVLSCVSASRVNAELATNAKVSVTSANIRSTPGTTGTTVIAVLPVNTRVAAGEVTILTADPSGKNEWCRISAFVNGIQIDGYIVNSFLLKDSTNIDSAFEGQIQNFPESYKPSLRSLHEAHSSWFFNPVFVGTDWNTVVAAESTIGTSLIAGSVDDSWKSSDPAAYNWLTNTYTPYDGALWVNASKDVVGFYLDPRNFLNDTYIFQFLNLSYDAGTQTLEAVTKLLNGTFMADTVIADPTGTQISYAQTFMQAGAASGTSPYQLVSRVIQEVSVNGSRSTSGIEPGYAGYYNFYNIGASSSIDPVILGLTFAVNGSNNPGIYPMIPENRVKYLIPWNSQYNSIVGGAAYIANNYILKGQSTMYFQKFDVTDDGNGVYRHQYMTNIQAMIGESTTLYNAYAKSNILNVPLTFNIPVYAAMPDASVSQPAATGNPNNYLAALGIDGYALTPTFDTAVTDGYSLIVPYQSSTVNITASPAAATSTISGTGSVTLTVGENPVQIKVTAKNGTSRTYNITIIRNEPSGEVLFETAYRVNTDNTLAGIAPGTTAANLSAGVTLVNGGQIVFMTAAGTVISDQGHSLATGDRILFLNASSAVVYEYTVLIYGDANGDGKVNSTDLTVLCRHVLKETSLTGGALLAADVNHDGKTNSTDLTVICRYVLKETAITQ